MCMHPMIWLESNINECNEPNSEEQNSSIGHNYINMSINIAMNENIGRNSRDINAFYWTNVTSLFRVKIINPLLPY